MAHEILSRTCTHANGYSRNIFISGNTGRISDIQSFLESLCCVLKLGLRYFFLC